MKPTKALDIRNLSDVEIASQIAHNQETLVKLQFQRAIGELSNTAQFRIVKKDIARMKTIIRERALRQSK
jgi:large subunit ribosomal protein L29